MKASPRRVLESYELERNGCCAGISWFRETDSELQDVRAAKSGPHVVVAMPYCTASVMSSSTKLVCRLRSSLPVNFNVTVWPI